RRRRNTRVVSDWSSDVCSSDLVGNPSTAVTQGSRGRQPWARGRNPFGVGNPSTAVTQGSRGRQPWARGRNPFGVVLRTQNSELRTQDSELSTQDSELLPDKPFSGIWHQTPRHFIMSLPLLYLSSLPSTTF